MFETRLTVTGWRHLVDKIHCCRVNMQFSSIYSISLALTNNPCHIAPVNSSKLKLKLTFSVFGLARNGPHRVILFHLTHSIWQCVVWVDNCIVGLVAVRIVVVASALLLLSFPSCFCSGSSSLSKLLWVHLYVHPYMCRGEKKKRSISVSPPFLTYTDVRKHDDLDRFYSQPYNMYMYQINSK